jgi:predicted nucleic acid-binding protein
MERSYLIDSNILIDYISQKFSGNPEQKLDSIFDKEFFCSIISRLEVLGFDAPQQSLDNIGQFLHTGNMYALTDEIADQTITIRRVLPKMKLSDAIIAATAVTHNLVLLTHNISDFKGVKNLEIQDPWTWHD